MPRQAPSARRPISRPEPPRFSPREIFSRALARDSHSTRFGPRAKSLRRCRNFFPKEVLCLQRKPFIPGDSATRRPVCCRLTHAGRSGAPSQSLPRVRRDSCSRESGRVRSPPCGRYYGRIRLGHWGISFGICSKITKAEQGRARTETKGRTFPAWCSG
jgi:hypothetical protein